MGRKVVNDMNNGISAMQAKALLAAAAKRLGKTPEELRAAVQNGGAQSLLSGLDENGQARAKELLADPAALRRALSDPGVREALARFSSGK